MVEKCIIIGLGQIAMGYDLPSDSSHGIYTHARAFSMHPAFELVGAVDPESTKRDIFEQNYGKPAYCDITSALLAHAVSVIVIAAPTHHHHLALKEVLACSTPKLILCEKPLAYDLLEAREMIEVCEKAGVKLFVNYMRRADPGVIEVKERIESGEISLPIKGVAWYSKGFLHNGSHFFNLLEFWLGSFVRLKILDAGRLWENQDPEPDVLVEFEKGKVVFLAAWEESFSHYTIELLSPVGRLRYEHGGESITWESINSNPDIAGYDTLAKSPQVIDNDMYRYQWNVVDQLANALVDKAHTLSNGRESLATLEAMHKIIKQRES